MQKGNQRSKPLRAILGYLGAFLMGMLCMHTISALIGHSGSTSHAIIEDTPQHVVSSKPLAIIPIPAPQPSTHQMDPIPKEPSISDPLPDADPAADLLAGAPKRTTYCDLIDAIDQVGKTVTGKGTPSVSQLLHVLGQSIKPFKFVQIGAHVGGVNASHDDTMPLTKKYGWHGLLVEPNPFLFKELYRKYQDWENVYMTQVGVGASDGNMTFYAVTDEFDPESGASREGGRKRVWYVTQLSTFDEKIARQRMRQVPMKAIPVEVNTFPTLVNKPTHTIKKPHYILIDTEGYDWRVLSTIDLKLYRPFIIMYEHNKLGANLRKANEYTAEAGFKSAHRDHQDTVCWRPCSTEEASTMPHNDLAASIVRQIGAE